MPGTARSAAHDMSKGFLQHQSSRPCCLQVSHHPPIGVGHGENDNWTYDIVSAPSTKFLGNSVEIYPIGVPTLVLEGSSCWKAAALFRHVVNH